MKYWLRWRHSRQLFAFSLLILFVAVQAQAKPIWLRNRVIAPAKTQGLSAASSAQPVSGLFIVQFAGALEPGQRSQLAGLGVHLLRYVPEDSFVARFHGARLDLVRALPFVEWVEEYGPDFKIHPALQPKPGLTAAETPQSVAVLLVPRATAAEIAESRAAFNSIAQQASLRSGTVLRGTLPPGRVQALARSHAVLWIEPAGRMKLFDEVASKLVAGDGGPQTLFTQSLGYDGTGVNVAVADSGLHNGDALSMHPDLLGRTPAFFYYGNLTDAADEHSHGTHVAGIVAGNGALGEADENGALYGLGVAPGAGIIAQRIFDGDGNYEAPPSFERLTRDATRAGAVIGSNSWGDDSQGRYDLSAMEFDELVRDADGLALNDQPYILEFSAGNAGPAPQSIGSPALAKNVLATGATENDRLDFVIYGDGPDTMADFSSRGPCEDGRIKPDIVAPGTWIASLQSESAPDIFAWLPISPNYQYQGGTSQAGPHASGAAAVFVQYYKEGHNGTLPSPALVKAALINTAYDLDDSFGTLPIPNGDEGWGSIDLTPFFDPGLNFTFIDQGLLLTNEQVFEHHLILSGNDEPLKIHLAYTDPPGLPAAIPALVNDLDLEVLAPNGEIYRGNQMENGVSLPNPLGRDSRNNVEGVILNNPTPGEYIVRVRGRSVVADIHGEPDEPGQDFALVISGQASAPGVGNVSLDRAAYRAPGIIRVTLVDTDLAGQPSVSVQVQSTLETVAETILLTASGSHGSFTGSIATATGPAVADGKLQIAHNNTIQVVYFDASANVNRTATARGDLLPPVLSNPSVTNAFGETTIFWTTDEPANSIVRLGTNNVLSSLNLAVTNNALGLSHVIDIGGLDPGVTYYYYCVSSDEAGNTATNSNNGSLFSFVVPTNAPILLINGYQDTLFGAPPITGYTAALGAIGASYEVWDTGIRGQPSFNNLRPYRVVIWRVEEIVGVWTASEQSAISNYLAGGGAMLVASMELLSRLQEAGATNFINNVLHVQSFVPDPDSSGALEIVGSPVEAISQDLDIVMDYTIYEDLWGGLIGPDVSDTLTPGLNATTILFNDFDDSVGIRWPGLGQTAPGRLVLLTFPLDAVPLDAGVNDRAHLLRNVITFLAPGLLGSDHISLDSPHYTLPSLIHVQVGDTDKRGAGTITVTASSTTESAGMPVTLLETSSFGVFAGSFPLISYTNPPTSGKLRGANGDQISVKYSNAPNAFITASATVDTNPPTISNVDDEPDYQQATIYWDTSEFADALVQFGESALMERTAYNPDPANSHAVTLFGLVPNRTYYYRVTSRDVAGNTVVDDNNGNLHQFKTLKPLFPPWSDDMNSGATNWSVFSGDDTQTEWTLGVPNNGVETAAHSPPAAWGCNLQGLPIDFAETMLISPAIYLTNGNVAKLNFWHSYDFSLGSDLSIEVAELRIVYNNGSSLATIGAYSDFSDGWEPAEVDLTPYTGQVVYLVWYYLLLDFESSTHPGWLVDDVSVTVSTVPPGTVVITNNIWQASYILSGSAFRKGKGLSTVISNTPSGKYILEFADVLYYNTPPAQTNTLNPGGILTFQGNYTFTDINSNNIPDPYETARFGTVDPSRTQTTDTDGDGLSDWAEFVAGTDPNVSLPGFRLTVRRSTNNSIEISWPSQANLLYRLHSSSNLLSWAPFTGWLTPTGAQSSVVISPTNVTGRFFRAEAVAASGTSATGPSLFRATANRLINGQIRVQWPSAAGHGYRLWGTTNLTDWAPFSAWIRAASKNSGLTLPPRTNGAPYIFRVEAQP